MLDLKWTLQNLDAAKTKLQFRKSEISLDEVTAINDTRKSLQKEFDDLKAQQNQQSKLIAEHKKNKQDAQSLIDAMQAVSARAKEITALQQEAEEKLNSLLLKIPNMPHDSVPQGADESQNVVVRTWGEKTNLAFPAKEHWEIGEAMGGLDFERGAKLAGSRFTVYRGQLAKLERALIHFMLEKHTLEHGYEEILPPLLVNAATLRGTGQLPKFEEDLFKTNVGYYLIPTAEVPVTNLFAGEILDEKNLPYSFCAYTPCFRSEAGSHGKDVKGLIRQHQFNKVELVKLVKAEDSYEALEELTGHAENILKALELPYRVMALCAGDMGFSAAKTYDIEVWLPGQNSYREISSCSNCEAFQGRRMNTRYRTATGVEHVHTLNGSGLAVGRTLIAILENYQNADGSVRVPKVLQAFMGCAVIGKSA